MKCKTLKNKIYAVLLVLAGMVPMAIDNDATALVFLGAIAVPMFFAKEPWVY